MGLEFDKVVTASGQSVDHRRDTRAVLLVWFGSRLVIIGVALLAHYWWFTRELSITSIYVMWDHFESLWYANIAESGYVGEGEFRYNTAYFPGTALVMRVGLFFGLPPALTGMLVSAAAGAMAALALGRLTSRLGGSPFWAVVAWVAAPTVVFVTAPWSEALFAAFAFWSWHFARSGRWWWAGLLAAGATLTRINGAFLVMGLLAIWLFSRDRRPLNALPLLLPIAVLAAHMTYLWRITGRWNEWRAVQSEFWSRDLVDPVTALINTWNLIFDFLPGEISTRFVAEIAAVLLVTIGIIALARLRQWPELIYVAITLASLATSTYYYSVPRTITILFPLWMVAGLLLSLSVAARWIYLISVVPLTLYVTVLFIDGQWIS